jgi:hypothetical protein
VLAWQQPCPRVLKISATPVALGHPHNRHTFADPCMPHYAVGLVLPLPNRLFTTPFLAGKLAQAKVRSAMTAGGHIQGPVGKSRGYIAASVNQLSPVYVASPHLSLATITVCCANTHRDRRAEGTRSMNLAQNSEASRPPLEPFCQGVESEKNRLMGPTNTSAEEKLSGVRKTRRKERVVIHPIDVESLTDNDMNIVDPGRALACHVEHIPAGPTTFIYPGLPRKREISPLPVPTTSAALRQNLLYLLSYHPASPLPLQRLVSYHRFYPYLQSTKSYNLLIGLALRHAAFGTAEHLLNSMRTQGIRADLETRKLRTRSLIRLSRWEEAWEEATRGMGKNGGGMPLPIWMEFLGTAKRGVQESSDRPPNYSARFALLMNHFPDLTDREMAEIPHRMVYLVVQMFLRMNEKETALAFTKSYLKRLPSEMDDKLTRTCLNIIHLHVIFERRRGLAAHHATRKTTNTLLAICPCLRPSSTTLLLLLSHLKRAKQCGTIANRFVRNFKKRWGPRMEDRRVRRRVACLALKEGRVDIAKAMAEADRNAGWARRLWSVGREAMGGRDRTGYRRLLRARDGKVFRKRGLEGWLWRRVRARINDKIEVA